MLTSKSHTHTHTGIQNGIKKMAHKKSQKSSLLITAADECNIDLPTPCTQTDTCTHTPFMSDYIMSAH